MTPTRVCQSCEGSGVVFEHEDGELEHSYCDRCNGTGLDGIRAGETAGARARESVTVDDRSEV